MDPDEVEFERQKKLVERQRAAEIELVKQRIRPLITAAQSGTFGVSPAAGQELISAINRCRDGLDRSHHDLMQIQQDTKLGISPDGLAMTKFNSNVAQGGKDSAMNSIAGLREILDHMETAVREAVARYQELDERSAGNITRTGT